ncbi:transporter substrate-binding domain-containing protein [Aquitalea sp. LB_tupeE]|uniref:transporter substrate-binding domain-containing protein n=1 Tax=Aquitalea sp. LB_tupeE TaxID=2748078 RepID=UPI0015BA6D62|nr:transporter substrate-binding domain-containing protein [Aquitalea sp. LB_tupeE]NWK79518.1 transporter substrate-binding domain-containing protein [Aquitalea sp. LB_tupeE]
MHRRTFTLGLLAASLLGSLWGLPAQAERLASIKQAGLIKIAIPADFPPFGSTGPDMKPQGYDIDTAELIGRELKVKVELVPVSSANRIAYLTTGKADLLISSLGKNPEREKVINFSVAYAPFFNGVFGPKDLTLDKPEGLAGKTVGVTRGSIEDLELSKVIPVSANLKRFEDNNATIAAYLAGQVQVVATGNVVATTINAQSKRPRRLEQKFLIKNSPCFVGVNKDDPQLLEQVNQIINKARKDGELNRISLKWLKTPLASSLL